MKARPYVPPTGDLAGPDEVALLVGEFYRRVAQDELLGPIFNDVAHVDWASHLPLIERFWNTQLFGAGTYTGAAMPAHVRLNQKMALRPEHFERWLDLFCDVVDEHFVGPTAENAKHRARGIARAIRLRTVGPEALRG